MSQTQATMTEQEAEAMAARLTRIWCLSGVRFLTPDPAFDGIEFCGTLSAAQEDMHLNYEIEEGIAYVSLGTRNFSHSLSFVGGGMTSEPRFGGTKMSVDAQAQQAFTQAWLPIFRRGCWLMGLPIEVSAHEKAEWMQGFSREEIEAWNLKV